MTKPPSRTAPRTVSLGLAIVMSMLTVTCQHPIRVQNWDSFSVVLERTACLGTCPAYTVKLYGSGLVEYFGTYNVDALGSRNTRIDPNKVRNLVPAFNAVGFLGLRDRYAEGCTDMPTAIISIAFDGKTKRVSNYYGGRGRLGTSWVSGGGPERSTPPLEPLAG
jgi:hypothetical protein